MNNKKKALLSAALGASLLIGTGGTFALWQASTNLAGSPITTGEFALNAGSFTWYDRSAKLRGTSLMNNVVSGRGTGTNFITRPATGADNIPWGTNDKLVPGDKVVGVLPLSDGASHLVTAEGTNLAWRLVLAQSVADATSGSQIGIGAGSSSVTLATGTFTIPTMGTGTTYGKTSSNIDGLTVTGEVAANEVITFTLDWTNNSNAFVPGQHGTYASSTGVKVIDLSNAYIVLYQTR